MQGVFLKTPPAPPFTNGSLGFLSIVSNSDHSLLAEPHSLNHRRNVWDFLQNKFFHEHKNLS